MKTKNFTKFLLMGAGLLLAGAMQAQDKSDAPPTASPKLLNDNAISLTTNGMGSSQGKGGFWGYAMGDYAYVANGDSAGRGTKQQYKGVGAYGQNGGQNAFEIRRAYLGYDLNPNKKLSGCVLLAYEGDADVNGNRMMYMKYAYIKIKNLWKGTDLKIGQQSTCSFASAYNTEPLLGYRDIEKTIMDIHGMDGSSDMGINLGGSIVKFKSSDSTAFPAFIGYNIMLGDNSGNTPVTGFTTSALNPFNNTTDNAKKLRYNVFFNALNGGLTVGYYGDLINYGNVYYNNTPKAYWLSVMTNKGYVVYNHKWFGIGFEYVMQTMTNGEAETTYQAAPAKNITDTVSASQGGFSVFAHGTIIQNCLNVFVRYDQYKADNNYSFSANSTSTLLDGGKNKVNETFASAMPNVGGTAGSLSKFSATPYSETFISAGIDWTPWKDKKMHIMPNVWMYQIKNAYGSSNLASATYSIYRLSFLFAF